MEDHLLEAVTACASRREALFARMEGGVALLAAAPVAIRSGDVEYPYRQDSDFHYLTGFPEPGAICLLAPEERERFQLFVEPRDAERELWTGPRAGPEGAIADYGADAAHNVDKFEEVAVPILERAPQVYCALGREDALARRLLAAVGRARQSRPQKGTGPTALRDIAAVVHEMRLRKGPEEISFMRRAIAIACEAHALAMQEARPEMPEYELAALLEYTFRRRGAAGAAYPPIVAGGAAAAVLHHSSGPRRLREGELVLVDAGAEWACYCADVTRTYPAGRRFSPAQRDLYCLVLAAQRAAIEAVAPGTPYDAPHRRALEVLCEGLIAMGLLEGSVEEAIEQERYRRFYPHRTSHWLGLDVHDVGTYRDGGGVPRRLEPGMVMTVEPGCYVRADDTEAPEELRGTGIRIEDDVLVTAEGREVLSAAAPKEIEAIEELRARRAKPY